MKTDERGLALSAESDAAVRLFDRTLLSNQEYRAGTVQLLKELLAAEPGFVMGHVLKGCLFMFFGSAAFAGKVAESLAFAEPRVGQVTAREAAHIAALRAWNGGDLRGAELIWDEILTGHPRDLLALRLQHFANFYLGRSFALRDAIARVLPAWDEGVPGHGFVHGMYAFGLEESGDYAAAEEHGRRAVEINGDDLWAIHAVAHVLEMQGRLGDGLAWLDQPLELWEDRNAFKGHLWWHRALYLFEGGDTDAALAFYDQAVRRDTDSDFYLDLVNAAALLWRLRFQGIDVGDRWEELADTCETRIGDCSLAFSDVHFVMAFAGAGRTGAAEREIAALRAYAKTPNNTAAATMEPVAIPLSEAILAFSASAYGRAIALMTPIRGDHACLGGSHAQRDIFNQFLIEAAIKGGNLKLARALLAERVALKPNSVGSWRKYANVLAALGETEAAAKASRWAEDAATA